MKDITTYINEVSKGLVQRAYNKATGAQKNRIKKLYKEIYGGDINKKDVSEIDFFVDNEELERYELYDWTIDEDRVKECFENWDQTISNTIERVKLYFEIETSSNWHETELSEYTVYIEIKLEIKYTEDSYKNLISNVHLNDNSFFTK